MLSETSISPSEVQGVGRKETKVGGGSVDNAVSLALAWLLQSRPHSRSGYQHEICMRLGPSPSHHGWGGAYEAPPSLGSIGC